MDMDGVLVHEEDAIPGAAEFIGGCASEIAVPRPDEQLDLHAARPGARLRQSGLDVPEDAIWTSALATPSFLEDQRPSGSAFVIGEAGLTTALHSAGYTMTERDPDFVILGETRTYSLRADHHRDPADRQRRALHRDEPGPDRPEPDGALPATGAVAALISARPASPYFVGKPNPLMMRSALNAIDAHSESTAMVGDRMDTDVVAGLEAGLHTVLVLTGVTTVDDADRFPFRPSRIVDSIADLVDELE